MEINQSFLRYAQFYSGIDGGDIDAEYWFMGIEWSNINDIESDYDEKQGLWKKKHFPKTDIKIVTDEGKEDERWKLENAMNKLYQILPHDVLINQIFSKGSNSLKLNLLPLPFSNTDAHNEEWIKYDYAKKTGFDRFCQYKRMILPYRQKLFKKLLQKGTKPKTIFCFGTTYHEDFLFALTNRKDIKEQPTAKTARTPIFVYDINKDNIKKIIICRFPTRYHFKADDWEKIYECAML